MQALRAEGFKSLTVSEAEGTGNYTKKVIRLHFAFHWPTVKCPNWKSYVKKKM